MEGKKVDVLPPDPEEQIEEKSLVAKTHDKQSDIIVRPSRFPWVNKFQKKNIESFTDVVKAKSSLMGALVDHSLIKGRLLDVEEEIETERLERQQRLREAKLKRDLAEKTRRLAELDLDVEIAAREKRLEELKKPERGPEKTAAERQAEHLEKLKEQLNFSARKDAVRLFGEFETRKEIEKEYERRRQEVLAGRPEDSLTEDERQALEDLADAKHYALDKL